MRIALLSIVTCFLISAALAQETHREHEGRPAIKLEPYEVIGTRLGRPLSEGPTATVTIDRTEIERRAPGNLSELLREMPEMAVTWLTENVAINGTHGTTGIDLRGLGVGNTLVLVDGRRVTASANAFDDAIFVDINRYPPGMIERIEIIKGGASAIYGADAVAGVINLVTRRRPSGGQLSVSYGNTFDTDAAETQASVVAGATRGRLGISLRASLFDRNALASRDRWFASTANLVPRFVAADPYYASKSPGELAAYDGRSLTSPNARITLVGGQVNGVNGVSIPGLAPSDPINALPGTGGQQAGTLSQATPDFSNPFLHPTNGQFNAGAAAAFQAPELTRGSSTARNLYNFNDTFWLVPKATRAGFGTRLEYLLRSEATAFADVSLQRNRSETEFHSVGVSGMVPRTNYYNPFGVDVNVAWRLAETGPRHSLVENDNYAILAGIRSAEKSTTTWEVAASYGTDSFSDATTNWLSASKTFAALARSDSGALNPFGGPQFQHDAALIDALKVTFRPTGTASLLSFDAKAARDFMQLPGGPVRGVIYAEHRRETFGFGFDDTSLSGDVIGLGLLPTPSDWNRGVTALATELRAPLMEKSAQSAAPRLALEASARIEQAEGGFNSGVRPTIGAVFAPSPDWTARASWATTFRAPSLPQLFSPQSEGYYNSVPDPRRPAALTGDPYDGPNVSRLVRSGGNPDLGAETGRVLQSTVTWAPAHGPLSGLAIEAGWFHYDLENLITGVGPTYVLDNELGGLGHLVLRDSTNETYVNTTGAPIKVLSGPAGATTVVAPGQSTTVPGRLQRIDSYIVNLSRRRLVGADLTLRWSRSIAATGRWTFTGQATYTDESSTAYDQQSPLIDNTGLTTQPYWRGRGSLVWERGGWNAGATLQYTPSSGDLVRDDSYFKPYRVLHLQVGYRSTRDSWLRGAIINLGVDDVFEDEPPLINDPPIGYSYSNVSRPQGRFWRISMTREW